MPSCLRVNVNQRDKPSEGVMGLTTDDPSAHCSHPAASPAVEPRALGDICRYSKECKAAHLLGAERGLMLAQAICCCCSPIHATGKWWEQP